MVIVYEISFVMKKKKKKRWGRKSCNTYQNFLYIRRMNLFRNTLLDVSGFLFLMAYQPS